MNKQTIQPALFRLPPLSFIVTGFTILVRLPIFDEYCVVGNYKDHEQSRNAMCPETALILLPSSLTKTVHVVQEAPAGVLQSIRVETVELDF